MKSNLKEKTQTPGDSSDEALMNVNEFSKYSGFSVHTIYEWISEKRLPLPLYRFGRSVRFKKSDINAWIESHRIAGQNSN